MSESWRTPEQLEARRKARARRTERRSWQQQMGGVYSWQSFDERERNAALAELPRTDEVDTF